MQEMNLQDLPRDWQREVRNLRAENARYRRARNALHDELAALKAHTNGE